MVVITFEDNLLSAHQSPERFRATRFQEKNKMQIFVRSVNSTFAVSVGEGATVADLKTAIEDVEFIPAGM